jgi:hypothetical protein
LWADEVINEELWVAATLAAFHDEGDGLMIL